MSEGLYSRVHFRVNAPTLIGQTIGVGGSCTSLGGFLKSKVLQLVTTPDSFPIWYSKVPVVVPRNKKIQYKYCIIEGGICKAFECSDTTRSITTTELDTIVEDNFETTHVDGSESEADLIIRLSEIKVFFFVFVLNTMCIFELQLNLLLFMMTILANLCIFFFRSGF